MASIAVTTILNARHRCFARNGAFAFRLCRLSRFDHPFFQRTHCAIVIEKFGRRHLQSKRICHMIYGHELEHDHSRPSRYAGLTQVSIARTIKTISRRSTVATERIDWPLSPAILRLALLRGRRATAERISQEATANGASGQSAGVLLPRAVGMPGDLPVVSEMFAKILLSCRHPTVGARQVLLGDENQERTSCGTSSGLVDAKLRGHGDHRVAGVNPAASGIWPEKQPHDRPKNPPKKAVMSQIRPSYRENPSCADRKRCWQQPWIAQAIFDARTTAEARRSLMPGELRTAAGRSARNPAPSIRARLPDAWLFAAREDGCMPPRLPVPSGFDGELPRGTANVSGTRNQQSWLAMRAVCASIVHGCRKKRSPTGAVLSGKEMPNE